LGIQMSEELGALPAANTSLATTAKDRQPQAAAAAISDADADLQARLENLRRE
jgi:charged multivesicular body protein 2A